MYVIVYFPVYNRGTRTPALVVEEEQQATGEMESQRRVEGEVGAEVGGVEKSSNRIPSSSKDRRVHWTLRGAAVSHL